MMASEGQEAWHAGNNFAVADGAILLFGFDARVVDALHAISALSITPRLRTVTSGLRISLSCGVPNPESAGN